MIELLSYITKENIIELDSVKIDIYGPQLIKACLKDLPIEEQENVVFRVKHNLKKQDLNMTKGFSLIHYRLDPIDNIRLTLGLLPYPKKSIKGELVNAVFCIIIPDTKCRTYLSLMAHLTRLLSKPEAKNYFIPGNKDKIIAFVREFEEA